MENNTMLFAESANNEGTTFIGRGWKFPIRFEEGSGVQTISGEDDIRNSLRVIFETRLGERVMQPDFGSELDTFLFSTPGRSLITYMEAIIARAILLNEPRIVLDNVEIVSETGMEGMLEIRIDYTVSATNNRYNYVYPFYIREATNLTV